MPDVVPACFRGRAPGGPPASTAAGPNLTTSVYETHLGPAVLTWSRTVLGLSLRVDLHLPGGGGASAVGDDDDGEPDLRFRVRPWLFWKRRGSRRFHLKDHRSVEVAWDLTRSRFPSCGGPEPTSGFFVAVVVDGVMLLAAGDLADEAFRKTKAQRPPILVAKPVLISRREHVVLGDAGGRRCYKTRARFGGKEREIAIEIGARDNEKEIGMSVAVDGDRVLQIRRLRWKFRGSEKVEVEGGGGRILVSWDLHNWLFQVKDEAAPVAGGSGVPGAVAPPVELGHAVFVFRFEPDEGKKFGPGHLRKRSDGALVEGQKLLKGSPYGGPAAWHFGKNKNWSESSNGDGGGGGERSRRRRKSLLKTTSSSSSTSSVSSGCSSTVMEWASQEEVELQQADGFSLLVYAWKC